MQTTCSTADNNTQKCKIQLLITIVNTNYKDGLGLEMRLNLNLVMLNMLQV